MNRRMFTLSLASLGLAPALPAVSLNAAPAAAVNLAKLEPWAKMIARTHHYCSQAMLERHLKIDAESALRLQTRLIEKNIIAAPGANGVGRAVDPIRVEEMFRSRLQEITKAADAKAQKLQPKGAHPEDEDDGTEDSVPARHADAHEGPGDLVTTDEGGGEDGVEGLGTGEAAETT